MSESVNFVLKIAYLLVLTGNLFGLRAEAGLQSHQFRLIDISDSSGVR